MKKKIAISLLSGTVLSLITLYLAFRNVPFRELLDYIIAINYIWIIPAVTLIIASFAVRAYRWRIILGRSGTLGFWQVFHPLMIGFMINCVLPGRVGEIARPAILKAKERIHFSTGLATVAAERVFDTGTLMVMFAVVLSSVPIDPGAVIRFGGIELTSGDLNTIAGGIIKMVLVVLAAILVITFRRSRIWVNRFVMAVPRIFGFAGEGVKSRVGKWCEWLVNIIENFAAGTEMLKNPTNVVFCMGLSALVWILSAASYYLFSLGCPGIRLTFLELSAVMIVICIFIALPSVPGFWGLWEAGGVFALSLFGIPPKEAAGFTLANHAIQMFPVIAVGVVSAMVTSVNILQVSYKER